MDAKDEVKRRLSVEEVVGDYLELKRAGRNFKGLSPFSSERTPSFMVSPEKQIWHDFSSNKGGDIFSFVMEVEGVDFREALEILARKASVDLSQYKTGDGTTGKLKKRLLEAHVLAAQFYHVCLSRKPEALSYIKDSRGFTPETIRAWQLGYSPEDGASLYAFLSKRGFTETELSKAGLITKRRTGWSDMFRGRIMIPLADGQGNVVGFTARLLRDDKNAPKYFNTPQSLIYDKGRQVFGLHHAKEAIRKADFAILVEGNLDVIASHQVGVANVVACAGTAMTADHLRSLSRLTINLRLAFDSDQAGINATERAIGIAQDVGVNLLVVSMPEGIKDPDELIQDGAERWMQVVEGAQDAVSWTLGRYSKMYDKSTAEGKKQLSSKALAVIAKIQDPVEREHHIKKLADELGTSVSSLNTKLQQTNVTQKPLKQTQVVAASPDDTVYEDDFLALNCLYPDTRESLRPLEAILFASQRRKAVFAALQTMNHTTRLDEEEAQRLHLEVDYVKILLLTAEEKYLDFSPAALTAESMALARRILKTGQKKVKEELTAEIRRAEASGESETAAKLLGQYQKLIRKE
ncbi:DNA primase [Candidatus Saccharibacteria bacterium]|nr:DNA primase [Candidatus Saccharibacteria bacterium]